MNSVTLRRVLVAPALAIVMAMLALLSVEVSRGARPANRPNARIMLRRVRDVRRAESRLLAERLDSDRIELGLIGVDVRVERVGDRLVLFGRQNAHIGSLIQFDSGDDSLFRCASPGMGQLEYALDR